jgi:hypothetical protein
MPCPTGPRGEKIVDVELVRADGTGYQTFASTDQRVRDRILVTLLGQNMTSVGSAGGFAQARVHENGLWRKFEQRAAAFGDAVLTVTEEGEREAGTFERVKRQWAPRDGVIRTQICRWFSYWNFGDMDLAPYTYWNATQPEDVKEQQTTTAKTAESMGKALGAVAGATEKLDAAGVQYDLEYMLEQVGVRLRRPDEEG